MASKDSRTLLVPFISALLGGAVVAAVIAATGVVGGETKTVVQQAPIVSAKQAKDGGLTVRDIYRRTAPGVVFITAQIVSRSQSPFDVFPQEQRGEATGSGFVIDKDGDILTNAHVVSGATKVTVSFGDDKTVDAKVVGKDISSDIALLKVDPDGVKLDVLSLGDSKSVQVGDPTLAIGNPFGLDRTLTTGVVSALQRKIEAPNGFAIDNVIQTDAAINPGNSGGPLLDAAGRVIGINSQIETGGGSGNVGIGFAVPINTAKKLIPQLKKDGRVSHAYLGITGVTIDDSLKKLGLKASTGVLVQTVQSKSPAGKAGIRGGDAQASVNGQQVLLGGDVIVGIGRKSVKTMEEVISVVDDHKPGDELDVELLRDGKSKTVKVKLGDRPSTSTASAEQQQQQQIPQLP